MLEQWNKEKAEAADSELPAWLDVLAEQLSRDAPDRSGTDLIVSLDSEKDSDMLNAYSLMPFVLAGVAISSRNMEIAAVYYLARQLARINVLALAEYEGLSAPTKPDRLVSEQEASLTISNKPLDEVVTSISSFVDFIALASLLVAGVVAWKVVPYLWGVVFAPPDPLNF
jgi:hypothetical protein